jgi:hypothetical protein
MNLIATIVLTIFTWQLLAQNAVPTNIRAANTLQELGNNITPNEIMYGIPLPPKEVIGDSYLVNQWRVSNILLYENNTLLKNYPTRYDLLRRELEVKSKSGVRVLEDHKVKSFSLLDSVSQTPVYFVNGRDYRDESNTPFSGFFEVMADGKVPLLRQTVAKIKKANYTVQFDVGSRDDKIIKTNNVYYVKDGTLYNLPRSRKKLLAVFENKSADVEKFLELNKLTINEHRHLRQIFEYYNSLQ